MKAIYLLLILSSFIFARQTQLILANFSNFNNAKNAVKSINKKINNNSKFKKLFKKYSLVTTYKKDGKYFSVIIKPFDESTTRRKVYIFIKSQYKDAYALAIPTQIKVTKKKKKIHKKDDEFPYIKPDSVQYINK